MKPIVLTKRLSIAIIAIAACATLVGASVFSTYLLPSHVIITSQPGISLFVGDTTTNTCSTTPLTSFDYGDVQQTQQKAGPTVCIKNTGGSATAYILQLATPTVLSSLSTQSALPQGVTLTWNFVSVARNQNEAGCVGFNTSNGDCLGISPGQQTAPITLSLSVDTSASPQDLSFTIVFTAFSTISG